jgi:hypothetical protein
VTSSVTLPGQGVSLIPGTPGEGTVTEVNTSGSGISGGPITDAGTLTVEWNAGTVVALAGGAAVNGGTLSAQGAGSGTAVAVSGAATLNKQNGTVTSEALVGATSYSLTLTNSEVASTSTVMVNATDSAGVGVNLVSVTPSDGSVVIDVAMVALTGTVKIAFAVMN